MNNNMETKIDGVQLLRTIANKKNDPKAAEKAFILFVGYFEEKIKTYAEVHARKSGFNERVAFEAIQCAFNKVWLYPSFSMEKAHCKNEERAIILWLEAIVTSQMYDFVEKGQCAQITKEEDLSIIEGAEQFIDLRISEFEPEKKMQWVAALERKLSALDEKHRIIYLTYKAYYTRGKKLPRTILSKLRKRLGITQVTIRVYKKEACEALNDLSLL